MRYNAPPPGLFNLFNKGSPFIYTQQAPIYLDAMLLEHLLDLAGNRIKVFGRQCENGGTGSRETDTK